MYIMVIIKYISYISINVTFMQCAGLKCLHCRYLRIVYKCDDDEMYGHVDQVCKQSIN